MPQATAEAPIKAYWQPGCTSCLRMKEFLTKHGVPVRLRQRAGRQGRVRRSWPSSACAPCRSCGAARTGRTARCLKDVARVAGIKWGGAKILPAPELVARLIAIQQAAQRFFAQIPDEALGRQLPNRPRSYAQLAYHIFNIADAWLEHEVQGLPLKEGAYNRVPPPQMKSKEQILAYGRDVQSGLETWWRGAGPEHRLRRQGQRLLRRRHLHDYLERTTWHSGQHVRQMMMVLGLLGIAPDKPVGKETFDGLPMPDKVWDDEKPVS